MSKYSALSDYYNHEPPTPTSTGRSNCIETEESTPRKSRHRPPLLPLKTAMRKSSSATGTANSSSSDLRLTPQTPSLRFAVPLTHYIDYQGGHLSVYLREHESTNKNDTSSKQSFSDFNVVTKNSVRQVDYRVPDRNRPLEVRVQNRSLYVDPAFAKDISPQISAFLLREYAAGHRSSVEPKLDDLHYDDVLEAVRACCPTDLGLFSTPVTSKTFSSLARISRIFQVQKLKSACELYVARLPLKLDELSASLCASMLNDSFKYGLNEKTKVRLLQAVVGLIQAEIEDPSRLPTYSSKTSNVLPAISQMIDSALEEYKNGRLNHDEMLNEARLKIPCRTCRAEEVTSSVQPSKNQLQVCKRCRNTICNSKTCLNGPCSTLVEQFMRKFAKEYTQN